jgi:hypothetical protein
MQNPFGTGNPRRTRRARFVALEPNSARKEGLISLSESSMGETFWSQNNDGEVFVPDILGAAATQPLACNSNSSITACFWPSAVRA